ncbi:UDP-N-acetylmuramoyl-tripeptide--D-alanyl-D-alanine ligase [Enemella sp. A6]|uniref:UDP-N-acetylmuramoyl-tripeptide--D-alanyl-D- alanine ligase n=1 Tax=Enemella sp. A6 TaxID=3440152 RepID=UPI003EBB5211
MRSISVEKVAAAIGAQLHLAAGAHRSDPVGPDVCRDSREVTPGALFVAFPGEKVDGHDYIPVARRAGASAAIAMRVVDPEMTTLVVTDPTAALGRLARLVVDNAPALTVIGITGSSGKTSTKDLMAHVLESVGSTVSPVGSQNNELGVPLTATRVDDDTRFLISEMGARGAGHIHYLCELTPPRIGVVLNVGSAHLGEFGSVEGIAEAKGELIAALPADGWAVLNHDDPRVAAMADRRAEGVRLAWTAVGERPGTVDAGADDPAGLRVWAEELGIDPDGSSRFTLHSDDGNNHETHPVHLRLVGRHQVDNAVSAAAVGILAGLPPSMVASALSSARPRSPWRMEVHTRADDVLILNDAYNANPDSMAAALDSTHELARHRPGTRVWAVLGDMLELGADTDHAHEEIGRQVAGLGFHQLVAVGQNAEAMCRGARQAGKAEGLEAIADPADVAGWLAPRIRPGDTVVVKASRGLALERVAEALASESDTSEPNGGAW